MQITVKVDVSKTSQYQKEYKKFMKLQKQHETIQKRITKSHADLEKLIINKGSLEHAMDLFFRNS